MYTYYLSKVSWTHFLCLRCLDLCASYHMTRHDSCFFWDAWHRIFHELCLFISNLVFNLQSHDACTQTHTHTQYTVFLESIALLDIFNTCFLIALITLYKMLNTHTAAFHHTLVIIYMLCSAVFSSFFS